MFGAGVQVGDSIYFADGRRNGLYKINIDNKSKELITFFDDFKDGKDSYIYAIQLGYIIYFIPYRVTEKFAVFNIKSKEIEYFNWCKNELNTENSLTGNYFVTENRFIWIFPYFQPAVIQIDTFKRKTKILYRKEYSKSQEGIGADYGYHVKLGNMVYLTPWKKTHMYSFNLDSCQFEEVFYKGDCTIDRLSWAYNDNLYVIKSDLENDVEIIDLTSNVVVKKKIFPEKTKEYIKSIACLVQRNEYVWLSPFYGKGLVKLNTITNEVDYFDIAVDCIKDKEYPARYQFSFQSENGFVLVSNTFNMPLLYISDDGNIQYFNEDIDIKWLTRYEISKLIYMINNKYNL